MSLLYLSWKNLINKPLSLLLSLVLFALGVGLISLLLILNKQLDEQFLKNQAGINMVIGAKGSPLQLILSSMYHVDYPTGNIPIATSKAFLNPKHPLFSLTVPLAMGDSYEGYRIVGTTDKILELYEAEIGEGHWWSKVYEVVLGAGVADDLNLKLGDTFKSSHGFIMDEELIHDDAESFKVVGILKPTGSVIDQLILTNSQSVWAVHDHAIAEEHEAMEEGSEPDHSDEEGHDHDHEGHHDLHENALTPLTENEDQEITAILIRFRNINAQTLSLPRNINENTDLMAANPAYEIDRLFAMMGTGEQSLRVMALIIMIVSGLSIFISLYSSLKDRKYELALMRVMGASRGSLFVLIVLEGLILAVMGYLLGITLSHLGMEVLAGFMKDAYRYTFSGAVFLKQELYLLAGALVLGFVAAFLPAIQAQQTDISETLAEGK
ncbi:MAG: peptide ABC transporter permease [Saprospiraceae bacterium]|nr:MAG: peptide ABC transporter permease [Saprospiraceae bacterium]